MATAQPCSPRRRAISRPMPLAPPGISATRSAMLLSSVPSTRFLKGGRDLGLLALAHHHDAGALAGLERLQSVHQVLDAADGVATDAHDDVAPADAGLVR